MEGIDDINEHDSPEVDKRLAMFKRMRQEMLQEESKSKDDNQKHKFEELNKKIESLEQIKKEKVEKVREQEEEDKRKQQNRETGNKNFLGNIKSFNVDDI